MISLTADAKASWRASRTADSSAAASRAASSRASSPPVSAEAATTLYSFDVGIQLHAPLWHHPGPRQAKMVPRSPSATRSDSTSSSTASGCCLPDRRLRPLPTRLRKSDSISPRCLLFTHPCRKLAADPGGSGHRSIHPTLILLKLTHSVLLRTRSHRRLLSANSLNKKARLFLRVEGGCPSGIGASTPQDGSDELSGTCSSQKFLALPLASHLPDCLLHHSAGASDFLHTRC